MGKRQQGSKRIDHSGSSFDEFLREEGILEEAEAVAIQRVITRQQKCSGSIQQENDGECNGR